MPQHLAVAQRARDRDVGAVDQPVLGDRLLDVRTERAGVDQQVLLLVEPEISHYRSLYRSGTSSCTSERTNMRT